MKSTLFAGLSATAILCFTPAASAFAPDLIRGCKVIAAMQKDATPADAIHAAYCLGVLDGIVAAVSKKQTETPVPDPCFQGTPVQPRDLAGQIVRILTEQPKISETTKSTSKDRGAMAAYIALALSNQCSAGGTKSP